MASAAIPLSIPSLELIPARVLCLHMPEGYWDVEALGDEVLRIANLEGKTAAMCQQPRSRHAFWEWLSPRRSKDWLARAGGVSRAEAARMIATFGNRIADVLTHNAGTPRCLLAVLAGLARKPAVLIYNTIGTDPRGRDEVCQFVESRSTECVLFTSRRH